MSDSSDFDPNMVNLTAGMGDPDFTHNVYCTLQEGSPGDGGDIGAFSLSPPVTIIGILTTAMQESAFPPFSSFWSARLWPLSFPCFALACEACAFRSTSICSLVTLAPASLSLPRLSSEYHHFFPFGMHP